jgi:guanylate kinase
MLSEMKETQGAGGRGASQAARGMLVVVSSPSGGGKGTLIQRALKTVPDLGYSVSFTTRLPREGERDGHDYHFISVAEFEKMIEAGELLEWAHVHGQLYGTGRAQVTHEVAEGRDIILEIDTQGAKSVRDLVRDAVSIFILPPSYEVLRERLAGRGSETPAELSLRLRNARGEVEQYREFDYVVVNDDADRAAAQLASIICAERARRERQEQVARAVLASFPGD